MRVSSQEIKGIKLIKYNKVKVCSKCGQEKSLNEFTKDKSRKDGYRNECKECRNKNKKTYIKKCEICGKEFKGRKNQLFCSYICSGISRQNRKTFNCEICGKLCSMKESRYNRNEHHYCSMKCLGEANSYLRSGENHWNYNPSITDEERKDRKDRKRQLNNYDDFIKEVYNRDNYRCVCCGSNKSGKLIVHHLNGYHWDKEHRTDVNNGITLCENCHKEFHHIYGYGNNTKEQFEEFINNKTNKTA